MFTLTVKQKVLTYLYNNGRRKPVLVSPANLEKKWGVPRTHIRAVLLELRDKGCITITDANGVPSKDATVTIGELLVNRALEQGGSMPFDRPARTALCREWHTNLGSLKVITYRLKVVGVVAVEDGVFTVIDDEKAANYAINGDVTTRTTGDLGARYYKYIKGYHFPKHEKPKPVKLPKKEIKHKFLELLILSGGELWETRRQIAETLGCHKDSVFRVGEVLERAGIVTYTIGHYKLINPILAKEMLAPWTNLYVQTAFVPRSSPPVTLSRKGIENTTVSLRSTVVSRNPREEIAPKTTTAAKIALFLLNFAKVREIETEIARRRLYYPKNYEKGKVVLAQMEATWKQRREATDEEFNRQLGQMYGKHRAIVSRIIDILQQEFDLGGAVTDELINLCGDQLRGMLPSIEMPNLDKAERIADWMEGDLLADDDAMSLLKTFIEHSKSSFVAEFASRGGLKFLAHLEAMYETEMPIIKQRYAFCVFCYLAQVMTHPFDPEHPDWFKTPDMIINQIMTDDSMPSTMVLAKALVFYVSSGFALGSLDYMGRKICDRLHEFYPRYYDNDAYLGSGWEYIDDAELDEDIYKKIEDWDKKHHVPRKAVPLFKLPMKYTAQWYDRKAETAKTYGLPGDVEILQAKASALRRWKLVKAEEQKQLMGLLNKPTRYDNPHLNITEWDERAWHVEWDPSQNVKIVWDNPELQTKHDEMIEREYGDETTE